jgi:hypothetical protein
MDSACLPDLIDSRYLATRGCTTEDVRRLCPLAIKYAGLSDERCGWSQNLAGLLQPEEGDQSQ